MPLRPRARNLGVVVAKIAYLLISPYGIFGLGPAEPLRIVSLSSLSERASRASATTESAPVIEREYPVVHCWACLARRLGTEEGKVRDAAQQLVITERQRFVLARRSCAGCETTDTALVLVRTT